MHKLTRDRAQRQLRRQRRREARADKRRARKTTRASPPSFPSPVEGYAVFAPDIGMYLSRADFVEQRIAFTEAPEWALAFCREHAVQTAREVSVLTQLVLEPRPIHLDGLTGMGTSRRNAKAAREEI